MTLSRKEGLDSLQDNLYSMVQLESNMLLASFHTLPK
jgi:hypothetical protein